MNHIMGFQSQISKWMRMSLACVAFLALPATAQIPMVERVTGSLQGGVESVKIDFSQPLSKVPEGFVVQSPARIALDLPNVGSLVGRTALEINQGNVRTANVVSSGDRTRVVLNLKQATTYKSSIQGKSLIVRLDPVVSTAASEATSRFAEVQSTDTQPLRDIDFRRGDEGVGKVSVNLGSSQVGVDIKQQGQTLVVEFLKSSLPEALRRRLDVSDFGTPVQSVTSFQVGDRVRMVVEPKGQWEHSAYQTDNKFVLEVRSLKTDPNKLGQGVAAYSGEKISLNFQSIDVRSLLQVIADFSNFNIITSDSVNGNVTLRLKDVPWDQALDIILQSKSLGMRKNGNVITIGPNEELIAKEKKELEAKNAVEGLEPLRQQTFQLNYAKATDIATELNRTTGGTLGNPGFKLLSARGTALAIARTNQLVINDTAAKLDAVQALLSKIDVPVRQVLIEARIVEADDKFGRSLGVKLGGNDFRGVNGGNAGYQIGSSNSRVAFGSNYNNAIATTGLQGGTLDATTPFVNLPAVGQGGYDPARFALSLFNANSNRFLNLEISALEAEGKGKVVSSPRVITADQVKAIIEQGTELPYQAATSSGATSVSFRKANLKLEVTPQITPEGNVILDVDVNKDSVGQATAAGFAIDTKHVKTQVLVENGGTVVIGGIFEMTERDDVSKVPVLGDVPVLGNLFKAKQKTVNKTELLIFLTPKLLSERAAAR